VSVKKTSPLRVKTNHRLVITHILNAITINAFLVDGIAILKMTAETIVMKKIANLEIVQRMNFVVLMVVVYDLCGDVTENIIVKIRATKSTVMLRVIQTNSIVMTAISVF
jgi:hypothetical protein